jgi:hypothetical protein
MTMLSSNDFSQLAEVDPELKSILNKSEAQNELIPEGDVKEDTLHVDTYYLLPTYC